MGFCGGCAKALLILFNFVFWLSGAAILAIGIWLIVDKNVASYTEVLNLDSHDQYFMYAAYLLIGFGILVFLVGFCGCCGAIRGSKVLLGLYIFFLVLIFAGELCVGIIMIIYRVQIEDKMDVTLKKSIREQYGELTPITDAWNVVQVQLDCCGGFGPEDYAGSKFDIKHTDQSFPASCCVLSNRDDAEEKPNSAHPKNATLCYNETDEYFNAKGCKEGLLDWAQHHTAIVIGIGIGIGCLQIFGVVLAFCLCRQVDREDKY